MTRQEIKEIRESAGLSVAKTANFVGVTYNVWRRYEHGRSVMPQDIESAFKSLVISENRRKNNAA